MAIELKDSALNHASGIIQYPNVFLNDEVEIDNGM